MVGRSASGYLGATAEPLEREGLEFIGVYSSVRPSSRKTQWVRLLLLTTCQFIYHKK